VTSARLPVLPRAKPQRRHEHAEPRGPSGEAGSGCDRSRAAVDGLTAGQSNKIELMEREEVRRESRHPERRTKVRRYARHSRA
jgi:hypothetical protein